MLSGGRRGGNYREASQGGKEKADYKCVVEGVMLLAQIIDLDFCPSLPAARFEKDLAAA